ncbi:hypothetical protein EB118_01455 [bacterium]|jgi:hypothetical protein|nr:hypothetical protein [bacterium]NBX98557.1 hypothetical protein [bacterium]NDC93810.1 hypothetical protein [bacterium]NDD83600.1 hypothetical protein [bacterium]NDG28756.1 hypothetical protein [bacterium]
MDIRQNDRQVEVVFNGETEAQIRRTCLAIGILCVDEKSVHFNAETKHLSATLAADAARVSVIGFLASALES